MHGIDRPDNQQPLQIDANSIQHNDAKAVTKFIGNVVLIGEIYLKGRFANTKPDRRRVIFR